MQITRFIKELLYQYECVTIPQFGAFLTRSFRAKVESGGSFYPPRKEVNFNQLLVANDGILANHIARKENITYEYALRIIEKEVSSWKKKIQTQAILFPGVGEIYLNKEKKIAFNPWGKTNFDLNSFGLHFFKRETIIESNFTPKPFYIMEDTNKEDLMFTPEQEENEKKSPIMRYVAIGLIGITLLGGSYYFSDRYVTEQRISEQEKAQKQIEKNVQEATFALEDLSPISVAIATNPIEEQVVLAQEYFSIIAGSFRSLNNAEKKLESLKAEGYPAELARENQEGLYRVAYGRYPTKKEAINMLYFIKYTLEEDAWYLEER